jgi:hypothetical protein
VAVASHKMREIIFGLDEPNIRFQAIRRGILIMVEITLRVLEGTSCLCKMIVSTTHMYGSYQ